MANFWSCAAFLPCVYQPKNKVLAFYQMILDVVKRIDFPSNDLSKCPCKNKKNKLEQTPYREIGGNHWDWT